MPQIIQNFHLDGEVDGRSTKISAGPRSRTGGFSLRIKIRNNGCIARAANIDGLAAEDGTLTVRITPYDGTVTHHEDGSITITTKR